MILKSRILSSISVTFLYFQLICSGQYYENWPLETEPLHINNYIGAGCFALHLILSVPVWITKLKWFRIKQKNVLPVNQQESINFGGLLTSWTHMIMLVYAMISLIILNTTDPVKLNYFPYNLIVYNFQIFGPSLYYVVLSTLFFSRKKSLKMYAKRLLFKNNIPQ